MTAADDVHKYFFHCVSEKIRHDTSIMPYFLQSKIIIVSSAAILLGTLWIKRPWCKFTFYFGLRNYSKLKTAHVHDWSDLNPQKKIKICGKKYWKIYLGHFSWQSEWPTFYVINVQMVVVVVVVLLFYVHGKHLRSCRDGQLT